MMEQPPEGPSAHLAAKKRKIRRAAATEAALAQLQSQERHPQHQHLQVLRPQACQRITYKVCASPPAGRPNHYIADQNYCNLCSKDLSMQWLQSTCCPDR